jgi:hypothetical protein
VANSDKQNDVLKYLDGFSSNDSPQRPPGKPGDPQLAALYQYLLEKKNRLTPDEAIVDFGCGEAIVGHIIAKLWDKNAPPHYVAVDLPDNLSRIGFPASVHNNSRKISVDDFLKQDLPAIAGKVQVIIIRNVLHELDIIQTARLFAALIQHLKADTDIYLQDMVNLPRGERGNAGWTPDCLGDFLTSIGIQYHRMEQESFGGTSWFTFIGHVKGMHRDEYFVAQSCAKARERQKSLILEKLAQLRNSKESTDTLNLVTLQNDCASIDLQLADFLKLAVMDNQDPKDIELRGIGILAKLNQLGSTEYAEVVSQGIFLKSGLAAILATKELLDIPGILRNCRESVAFAGYSQRALFQHQRNIDAMKGILQRGGSIRILLCDPDSTAAQLRSKEAVYLDPSNLIKEILATIDDGMLFHSQCIEQMGAEAARRFEMRISSHAPSCSYFIVDDSCFVSLYSHRLTGSRGPCLVFKSVPDVVYGYYEILKQDFMHLFAKASQLAGGSSNVQN